MKTEAEFKSSLSAGARALGVTVDQKALQLLFRYHSELQRWNRRINLVSRKQLDWVRIHFLDSLAPVAMGLLKGSERIVDLGAGAGFPGLPLKIVLPGVSLAMAEASARKCAFLRHVLRSLDLREAEVLEGRFEELAVRDMEGGFDVAVSRAAAKPTRILSAAAPFLSRKGKVLIYTSENLAEEGLGRIHPYRLGGSKVPSVIWEIGASDLQGLYLPGQ